MNDSLRESYDAVPYRHGAIPESHPARMGFIARLLGQPAAAPDRCRVLELGCAEGMNLLPLAERLPRSEFVGVDFSPAQIAVAEETQGAAGIKNARLICADLRSFEPEAGSFDYVIAHGVYSWVPDDVKDRLLATCARALKPGGVAYVSYNTLPGWGLLSGLRRFLRGEMACEKDPHAQLAHVGRILETLEKSLADQPGGYAAMMREAVADMRRKEPALLYHDELSAVNDPCTFTEFTAHAARHGLSYLAEAHFATMPLEHVPEAIRAALAELKPDVMRTQQFMDVIFQRWLRNSLLCRAPISATRAGDLRVVPECAVGLRMRLADEVVNLDPGVKMRLLGPNGVAMEFDQPFPKAFFAGLIQSAPMRLPFRDAVARAREILRQAKVQAESDIAELCRSLYRLFILDCADLLLAGDGEWLRTGEHPAPSALMSFQAQRSLPLANRWHEAVTLSGEGRHIVADPTLGFDEELLDAASLLV